MRRPAVVAAAVILSALFGTLRLAGAAGPNQLAQRDASSARPVHLVIETVLGTGDARVNGNSGTARSMNIGYPFGVEVGPDGHLYVTEVTNHRIWRVNVMTGEAVVVAGIGQAGYSGDGGPAVEARLNEPYEVRFATDGTMYFVEMQNHVVRKVDPQSGRIFTVAGTGREGDEGDGGPATAATFRQPHSIALHGDRQLLIADIGNHRIRQVDLTSGRITTLAGTGRGELPVTGGPIENHPVLGPRALFVADRFIWVALREGHSIWRIDTDRWTWERIAGSGQEGYTDGDADGLLASRWNGPKGISIDREGRILVADTENQVVRRIDLNRRNVETLAGRGPESAGYAGDGGPAVEAQLNRPHGICVGPDGTIYIGDTLNHRVRAIGPRPLDR